MTHTDDNAALDTFTMTTARYGTVTLSETFGRWTFRNSSGDRIAPLYLTPADAVARFTRLQSR